MGELNILLIDDDQHSDISKYLREKIVTDKDWYIYFETDWNLALKKYRENIFSVVIVNLALAAYENVIKELKKLDPEVIIIAFLGRDSVNLISDLDNLGIYDYITTPINIEKLNFSIKKGANLHSLMVSHGRLINSLKEHNASLQKQNVLLANRIEDSTGSLTRLYEDLRSTYMRTIKTLAQVIDARDHFTHSHSQNVAKYAIAICEEMHFPAKDIEIIREACELHDLGKIGIQDDILIKPGGLDTEEWEKMKHHPIMAAQILEPLTFLGNVVDLIRQHHEHYDGTGYPQGLRGEEILLGARIIHLADAYDAMRSARSYRKNPLSKQEAIQEIKNNTGKQFDPNIVKIFLKIVDKLDLG